MNAAELMRRVHAAGADLRLGGPTGIELVGFRRLDHATIATIRAHHDEIRLLLSRRVLDEAEAIVYAQQFLRECLWQAVVPFCQSLGCRVDEVCSRCGGSRLDHFG